MKNVQVNIHDLGDASAVAFANNKQNDERVQKSLMAWHVVKCKNCRQQMSLVNADYDETFAPIHKNCGVFFHG